MFYKMDRLTDPLCGRCRQHNGDLIHLLLRCPKLHRYWSVFIGTLNLVFSSNVPLDVIGCILGVLEEVIPEELVRIAFFQDVISGHKTYFVELEIYLTTHRRILDNTYGEILLLWNIIVINTGGAREGLKGYGHHGLTHQDWAPGDWYEMSRIMQCSTRWFCWVCIICIKRNVQLSGDGRSGHSCTMHTSLTAAALTEICKCYCSKM